MLNTISARQIQAVINIKTDPEVKAEAQELAAELGLSLSALINGFLRQFTRTKTVTFSVGNEEPKESQEDAD